MYPEKDGLCDGGARSPETHGKKALLGTVRVHSCTSHLGIPAGSAPMDVPVASGRRLDAPLIGFLGGN
jgi:hypothetical protein